MALSLLLTAILEIDQAAALGGRNRKSGGDGDRRRQTSSPITDRSYSNPTISSMSRPSVEPVSHPAPNPSPETMSTSSKSGLHGLKAYSATLMNRSKQLQTIGVSLAIAFVSACFWHFTRRPPVARVHVKPLRNNDDEPTCEPTNEAKVKSGSVSPSPSVSPVSVHDQISQDLRVIAAKANVSDALIKLRNAQTDLLGFEATKKLIEAAKTRVEAKSILKAKIQATTEVESVSEQDQSPFCPCSLSEFEFDLSSISKV